MLFISLNITYKNLRLANVSELPGTKNDTKILHKTLVRMHGRDQLDTYILSDIPKYFEEETHVYPPTKNDFINIIRSIKKKYDTIFISFHCHGIQTYEPAYEKDNRLENIAFISSCGTKIELMSEIELRDTLQTLSENCNLLVIINDICHSGGCSDQIYQLCPLRGTLRCNASATFANLKCINMSACQEKEYAGEIAFGDSPYGIFSFILCDILEKLRAEYGGNISWLDLITNILGAFIHNGHAAYQMPSFSLSHPEIVYKKIC